MDRFEKLIDLGLDQDQAALLTTPIKDLGDRIIDAIRARDALDEIIRKNNAEFVPSLKPFHYVISDDLGAVQNPADGKTYDSKSAYYKAVKDAGCVVLGNEKIKPRQTTSISKEALRSGLKEAAQKHGLI